jgi:hypothetical protein
VYRRSCSRELLLAARGGRGIGAAIFDVDGTSPTDASLSARAADDEGVLDA